MVDGLRPWGAALSSQVGEAMRAVPRHLFLPGVPLKRAYGPDPVVTYRDGDGAAVSSASSPGTVAGMLAQLDALPGHRVLEIGAGTGYNAALLAYLVGPAGSVTTIEYDADAARTALSGLGEAVTVVQGDGMLGGPEGPVFDRIVVTAGAWDIPKAWWAQRAEDGRLVVPLRLLGPFSSVPRRSCAAGRSWRTDSSRAWASSKAERWRTSQPRRFPPATPRCPATRSLPAAMVRRVPSWRPDSSSASWPGTVTGGRRSGYGSRPTPPTLAYPRHPVCCRRSTSRTAGFSSGWPSRSAPLVCTPGRSPRDQESLPSRKMPTVMRPADCMAVQ
ncbi:hypothetical protein I6A60_20250 [Frankia sp. AgB1.9]|nr:hypothetical protein [Frankia sp. AgW1.1]MBL7550195.1 hypothetical protein [Frankia sp. AgB1.9]MBL7619854.1 hypothetical protein [Frankia sp. AgB1.8]